VSEETKAALFKTPLTLRVLTFVLVALSLAVSVSCGGGGGGNFVSNPSPPTITSITVSCNPTSVQTGQTSQCTATVAGTGSYSSAVTWSASAGTINSSGLFTAPGTASTVTVTATSAQDSTKAGNTTVTVTAAAPTITSVTVSCNSTSVQTGQTSQCTATVAGTGSYSSAVTWSASAGTINSSGLFTAPGTASTVTVTATSVQDSTKAGNTTVTVTAAAPTITSVTVSCNPTSVQTGQTSQCTATVTGTGNYSSAVTWSASVGTINSSGLFTAPGTASTVTVTATSAQDSTKAGNTMVTVTTTPPTITSVSVSCNPASVQPDQTSQCMATVTGTGNYSSAVTWSASAGTINSSGLFAAPGTASTVTVDATSVQDSTKVGNTMVTVTTTPPTITSVTVSCNPTSVQTGQTSQCTATVAGTGNYNSAVTWSVSSVAGGNAIVGTISAAGLYTAPPAVPTPSTVTVTATSQADASKSGFSSISLLNPAPAIQTIAPNSVTVGSANTLLAIFGTGFNTSSTVNLDGTVETTTLVSPTEVTITIPAGNQTVAGTHNVTVSNPSPGGGTSNTMNFAVDNLVPALSSLDPSTVKPGSSETLVTLYGANFLPTSTASSGSGALAATFVSANQMIATVPAASLASSGTVSITVSNPTPGGGTSSAVNLNVSNAVQADQGLSDESVGPDPSSFSYIIGTMGAPPPSSAVQQQKAELATKVKRPLLQSNLTPLCTFDSSNNTPGAVCVPHVPWMPQVPPGTTQSPSANCGIASYLMVKNYYQCDQCSPSPCDPLQQWYDFKRDETKGDCSDTAQQIIGLLQRIDPAPVESGCNPIPLAPDGTYPVYKNVTLLPAECVGAKDDGHDCLYYNDNLQPVAAGLGEYFGPMDGLNPNNTLVNIAQNSGEGGFNAQYTAANLGTELAQLNQLLKELNRGNPVIVHVRYKMRYHEPDGSCSERPDLPLSCSGHYMVVVGMDVDSDNNPDTSLSLRIIGPNVGGSPVERGCGAHRVV